MTDKWVYFICPLFSNKDLCRCSHLYRSQTTFPFFLIWAKCRLVHHEIVDIQAPLWCCGERIMRAPFLCHTLRPCRAGAPRRVLPPPINIEMSVPLRRVSALLPSSGGAGMGWWWGERWGQQAAGPKFALYHVDGWRAAALPQ